DQQVGRQPVAGLPVGLHGLSGERRQTGEAATRHRRIRHAVRGAVHHCAFRLAVSSAADRNRRRPADHRFQSAGRRRRRPRARPGLVGADHRADRGGRRHLAARAGHFTAGGVSRRAGYRRGQRGGQLHFQSAAGIGCQRSGGERRTLHFAQCAGLRFPRHACGVRRLPADLPFRIQHSTLGGPAVLRLLPRLYAAPGDVLQRPAGHRAVPPCNVSLRIALDGDNPGGDLSARLETPALSPSFFAEFRFVTLMTFVYLIAGLVLLVAGAEVLVRGAAKLAAQFGISPLIIGLTVVAFGTSAPETAVSVQAAVNGSGDIAIGNVVGSNIANVLLILGLTALVTPLVVSRQLIRLDVPIMIGASLVTFALAWDGELSRLDGALLFAAVVAYTLFLIISS